MKKKTPPVFVVSGGKGIAGHTMVHSLIIQYPENNIPVKIIPEIQTQEKIIKVVQKVKNAGGLLTHTMVNSKLRKILIDECEKQQVAHIDFMGPLADYFENQLGLHSINIPGLYRRINAQYFDRIEAIDYTLNHDDGINSNKIKDAEIILTGVSRSGKTPLSVYMSMFGWKVANIPLVKGISPPKELFEVDSQRVFALKITPSLLIAIRQKRLNQIGDHNNMNYTNERHVREELRYANMIFEKGGFTSINVSNKPIETTANEIIDLVSERFGYHNRKKNKNNLESKNEEQSD